MAEVSPIPKGPWTPANSLQQYNALVDRINELQATVATLGQAVGGSLAGSAERPASCDIFLGYTITTPPNGSPGTTKYTDARYYVVRSVAPDPAKTGSYSKLGALTDNLSVNDDPFNGPSQLPTYVTATNRAELPGGKDSKTASGTHLLADNTIVLVIGFPSRQNPVQRTYVFYEAPPGAAVIRITAYDAAKGYYVGHVQVRKNSGFSSGAPADFSDDVDFKATDYYQDGASVIVLNLAESAFPIPVLGTDGKTFATCTVAGTVSDASDPTSESLYQCDVPIGPVVVRIDHKVGSGGVYTGPALYGISNVIATSDSSLPNGLIVGTVQCNIVNIEESGQTGWRLPVSGSNTPVYAVGNFVGMSTDATPVPIIMIRGALGDLNSILDLSAGTYSSGSPSPNATAWDWNTNAQAVTYHPLTAVGYDGSTNASGSAPGGTPNFVTTSGTPSRKLWFRPRMVTDDARGVTRKIAGETTTPGDLYLQLKAVQVGVASINGSGDLIWTPQQIWVIDFDNPGTAVTLVSHC